MISVFDYGKSFEQKIFNDIPITSEHLLKKNAYPIRIQIINKSNKSIIISPQSFNASSSDYTKLAKDLHYHEIIRPVLTHLGISLAVGPGIAIAAETRIIHPIHAAVIGQLIGLFSLAGNIKQWWDLRNINKKIDQNICHSMCLNRSFVIPPKGQLNKIVLLGKNELLSVPELSINIYGQGTNTIIETFNIHIG